MAMRQEQLERALELARKMQKAGTDPAGLAEVLLQLYQQNRELQEVFDLTERYLAFGMPQEEHGRLSRLIEQIRERRRGTSDELDYGL